LGLCGGGQNAGQGQGQQGIFCQDGVHRQSGLGIGHWRFSENGEFAGATGGGKEDRHLGGGGKIIFIIVT
jgi:hypothetical protein